MAGIELGWQGADGMRRRLDMETLRRVMGALGFPCGSRVQLANTVAGLRADQEMSQARFVTANAGTPISIGRATARTAEVMLESGGALRVTCTRGRSGQGFLPPISEIGYHRLRVGNREVTLAVAPRRCFGIDDIEANGRLWGLAAQAYSVKRRGDGGIGDWGGIAILAEEATKLKADAVALSPASAVFLQGLARFEPYSPSSRLCLNPLHADPAAVFDPRLVERVQARIAASAGQAKFEEARSIDWKSAANLKLAVFRELFDEFSRNGGEHSNLWRRFGRFRSAEGAPLGDHARFEAIGMLIAGSDEGSDWRNWPSALRNPRSREAIDFGRRHEREILFHEFLQWLSNESLAAAHRRALAAGMRIGLISDLTVGISPRGSQAWAYQSEVFNGLSVGAPPDAFNRKGQDWGLTTHSPQALWKTGFDQFLRTIRVAMRHAGGIRIDHIIGLNRLWLIPSGAPATEGAYVRYPLRDLLRLVALESHRHRVIVIGEDLGTVPAGFSDQLERFGILGTRVLWFERGKGGFRRPERWPRPVLSMATTHDLPTVTGWWRGRDIGLRAKQGHFNRNELRRQKTARAQDRRALWNAFLRAGVASGRMPGSSAPAKVVDAALQFVARAPNALNLVTLEDVLGSLDQPNMPGTIDEHPNWQRRFRLEATEMLRQRRALRRLKAVSDSRRP